ncbi:rho GTPase-activating protein 9-like [Sylvia borin]
MLPGWRWRRAGPAVSVRALYTYRYRAGDGRDVAVTAGERLLLLRRATPDWWQVRRPGDPPWARPFFVPAAYVAEEEPGNSGRQRPGTPTGAGGLSTNQPADGAPPSPQQDSGVPPTGPAKEEKPRPRPPVPTGPPLEVLGSWERHRDPESGRCFFYSPESGTSSWKPPRRHRPRGDTAAGGPENGWVTHGRILPQQRPEPPPPVMPGLQLPKSTVGFGGDFLAWALNCLELGPPPGE